MFHTRANIVNIRSISILSVALTLISAAPSFAGNFRQNHPRRAEVMGRNRNLNNRANLQKGNLDGHYGQIKSEDQAIARQQRRDARINGGYITKGQQAQLNREENHVSRQIYRDSHN